MIHAEYVEFDQPTGERVRRLEVFGHAGYAPRGQDIVCAGASMLMETLVYVLADCDEAECCAYNEPTGPRVSVKLTGSIFPTDLTAMEFAKTGLALLAERYPENIHYEDKSQDGQEKMVNLQLFAEGGGDGGTAATAASAADAAPAVQEPVLRPAEERLARRSGVLKRNASGGADKAANGNPPHPSGSTADGMPSQSPDGDSSHKVGTDASDPEAAENRKEAEGSGSEDKGEEKARTPEERKKAFQALMQGEYKAEAEEMMQRAVQLAAQRLEASPAMKGLMEALAETYGTDANDLVALTEAVKNGAVKDDAYYEKLAMEKGVSTKTARELDKLESRNRQLTAQQEAARQMERQRAQQARIAELQAGWDREAEQLKAQYPFFDKAEVLANPEIEQLMRERRLSMTNAFRLAYFDRIQKEQAAATARQVEQGVVARQQQRAGRPGENGTRPGGAVQTKFDVSHMTRKEAEDIEKRVMRGEIITL